MRIALFSDVHANLPALETFIEATQDDVDRYVCLGDVVDYGPWNDECLDLILSLPGIVLLEGNHERLFSGDESIAEKPELAKLFFHASRACFTRTAAIRNLPQRVQIGDWSAQHTIGDLRLYPNTPLEVTGRYFVGHSHYAFRRDFPSGGILVNCGSVGQNRERLDCISYALYDTEMGTLELKTRPYPLGRFVAEMEARHFPRPCIDYYLRNRSRVS